MDMNIVRQNESNEGGREEARRDFESAKRAVVEAGQQFFAYIDRLAEAFKKAEEILKNGSEELVDEPDAEDFEFAERAEDDKQRAFDDSRGVGQ